MFEYFQLLIYRKIWILISSWYVIYFLLIISHCKVLLFRLLCGEDDLLVCKFRAESSLREEVCLMAHPHKMIKESILANKWWISRELNLVSKCTFSLSSLSSSENYLFLSECNFLVQRWIYLFNFCPILVECQHLFFKRLCL